MNQGLRRHIAGLPTSVVAGFCYVTASVSMVLLNKHALSSFDFECPNALLVFQASSSPDPPSLAGHCCPLNPHPNPQCLVAVILVKICELVGLVQLEPLNMKIIQVRAPPNRIIRGNGLPMPCFIRRCQHPLVFLLLNRRPQVWYPANFIFVGMIFTSFYALKSMGVAMVTGERARCLRPRPSAAAASCLTP